jgi:2-polyprenyl-3-methyl-5-hydroxy-6-metoxy-1,4-benzoquinol methylase
VTDSSRDSTPRGELDWAEAHARNEEIRARHYEAGDYTGWFEGVYAASAGRAREVPWARLSPNPLFVSWADRCGLNGRGERALAVGCGLGDDAEEMARRGFSVTAFDISPSAIEWCRTRFPDSRVSYCVEDLFQTPSDWRESYSFVLEASTLQSLPEALRPAALAAMADCVAPGGTLLLIAFARMPGEDAGEITPWPLLREELTPLRVAGLEEIRFETLTVKSRSRSPKRFRVEYRKPTRQS